MLRLVPERTAYTGMAILVSSWSEGKGSESVCQRCQGRYYECSYS